MAPWSLLAGSPRAGELPTKPPGTDVADAARRAWLVGALASVALTWALGGVLARVFAGVPGLRLALWGALPLALLAFALLAASRARGSLPLLEGASAAGTLALGLAVAGHVLHAPNAADWWLLPPQAAEAAGLSGAVGVVLLVAGLLVAPLWAGARVAALGLALDATGRRAPRVRGTLEALACDDPRDLLARPEWRRAPLLALRRLGEGLRLPGLLALDLAATLALRALPPARDRLHAEVEDLDALAAALPHAERAPRGLLARPAREGEAVSLVPSWTHLPSPGPALDLSGPRDAVVAVRRLLEGPLAHHLLLSRSLPARRWERRLNALHREAERAASVEERGVLLDEAQRVGDALAARALNAEERAILRDKQQRLATRLAQDMLSGDVAPPHARPERRPAAPAPVLAPALARVMEAGGLGAMRRLTFAPYWVLPVRTAWGEHELPVDAASGKVDLARGLEVLGALEDQAPTVFPDLPRGLAYPVPAPPTAAVLRSLRETLRRDATLPADATVPRNVETVLVPRLPAGEGAFVAAAPGERGAARLAGA